MRKGHRLFGFLPLRLDLGGVNFAIATLDSFDSTVERVLRLPRMYDGWLWPPARKAGTTAPEPLFTVPMTHELMFSGIPVALQDVFAEYLVSVVGFLHGIALTPEGWVHLTRVRVQPGQAHDYLLEDSARIRVLELAIRFWEGQPERRDAMVGILYWHTAAQASQHDFERFAWQYSVLDACWRLHVVMNSISSEPRHAERISILAKDYDLTMPKSWDAGRAVAKVRNKLLHEARWGGKPVGFGGRTSSDMSFASTLFWFNTRLILAILGETGAYVRSSIEGVDLLFD
jgi:hypothetical protein